jgi:hypothetical protein
VTSPADYAPFLEPLAALQRLLSHFSERGVIMGGIAVSLLGKPRLTADLDAMFLLSPDDIPNLIGAAKHEGIVARIGSVEEFAHKNRVVLLRHQESGTNIDISLGMLPFEEEIVERSILVQAGTLSVRLPTPEDLIILKAVANRPRDLLDIQTIIESHPDLDRERIESWVRQFAIALDMPELWTDIADLLAENSQA